MFPYLVTCWFASSRDIERDTYPHLPPGFVHSHRKGGWPVSGTAGARLSPEPQPGDITAVSQLKIQPDSRSVGHCHCPAGPEHLIFEQEQDDCLSSPLVPQEVPRKMVHAECWQMLRIACCLLAALLISAPISWFQETLIVLDYAFLEPLLCAFTIIVSSMCKALGKK